MKYFIPLIALGLTACSAATMPEPATAPELSTDIESRIISMADN